MKPAPFEYVRPASLAEACSVLAHDPDARLIAGGQTLVPMMAMRLANPSRLVDIARLDVLRGVRDENDAIVLGAVTRQVEAERSDLVAAKLPLLAAAMPWIGHAPTRARGTIGGSIANADPAAEIPLVLVTLGGSVRVRDDAKDYDVAAADLFVGPMTTAIPATACITAARFPVWREPRIGVGFHEVSARKSDYAYVAAAAQVALDDAGRCVRCALGIGGATPVPTGLGVIDQQLRGTEPDHATISAAVAAVLADIEIMQDAHVSTRYRRRVAQGLAERALTDAIHAARADMGGDA